MNKKHIILSSIFFAILAPILIINLTIIIKGIIYPNKIPDFMGYKPFIVLSGSMESSISVGDLVIVKETDYSKINKNDIIAFRHDDIVITHRVVEVINSDDGTIYKSKGDSNDVVDDFFVKEADIEGVYVTKISGFGNIFMFLSKPMVMLVLTFITIAAAGIIYLLIFIPTKEDMEEFEEYKKRKLNNSKK